MQAHRRDHLGVRAWLLVLALLLGAAAPAWSQARLRVGIYDNTPKVGYGPDGRPQGIFIDVIEHVARQEGWTLDYVPGSFAQGLERLQRGELDLMSDVARTPAREELFSFHREPVLHSWSQVYARRGSGIRNLLDLSGKRIAVLEGSVQQEFLLKMAEGFGVRASLVPWPDYASAIRAVAAGEADAVITNPLHGGLHARAAGLDDTAIIFAPSSLHFAAPRGADGAVLAALDRHLAALKQDPTSVYFASLRRWTEHQRAPILPPWFEEAAVGAAVLLALALAWAFTLHRAAARLRHSERLQRELAEERRSLVEQLQGQAQELQRANGDLQTFSQSVSHDLRAPLGAIAGFVGKVLRDCQPQLGESSAGLLRRVLAATGRMEQIIEDLLRLAQVSELPVQRRPCDLAAIAAEVADALRGAQPGAAVEVEIQPDLPVSADPRLLRIVLENLLGNAWKFSARVPQPRIAVGREGADGADVFYVRDNGAGFDMEYAGKLFAPFQRLHTQEEFPGTGVGLSIAQRIVARHGGRIWAEGAPGAGAVFRFTLG